MLRKVLRRLWTKWTVVVVLVLGLLGGESYAAWYLFKTPATPEPSFGLVLVDGAGTETATLTEYGDGRQTIVVSTEGDHSDFQLVFGDLTEIQSVAVLGSGEPTPAPDACVSRQSPFPTFDLAVVCDISIDFDQAVEFVGFEPYASWKSSHGARMRILSPEVVGAPFILNMELPSDFVVLAGQPADTVLPPNNALWDSAYEYLSVNVPIVENPNLARREQLLLYLLAGMLSLTLTGAGSGVWRLLTHKHGEPDPKLAPSSPNTITSPLGVGLSVLAFLLLILGQSRK